MTFVQRGQVTFSELVSQSQDKLLSNPLSFNSTIGFFQGQEREERLHFLSWKLSANGYKGCFTRVVPGDNLKVTVRT